MHWIIFDLTPEEHDRRRQILNVTGYISAAVSMLAFCALAVIYTTQKRYWNHSKGVRWLVQLQWWAGRYISNNKPFLGTRGLWIGLLVSSAWLVILSITNTTSDYLHLTKRCGQIAASLFPLLYLLSAKSLLQFASPLTGQTYETLNIVHRWTGRSITTLLFLHGGLYINFFFRKGFYQRFRSLDVILGLILLSMMITIGVSSLPAVRRKSYILFFGIHVTLSFAILPVAWFHTSHLRPYVLAAGLLLIADKVLRVCTVTWTTTKILPVGETTLTEMNVDIKGRGWKSRPGQHVVVTIPGINWFRHHPFTIESRLKGRMRLVARTRDNFTKRLEEKRGREVTALLETAYGGSGLFPNFEDGFEKVLFIAGGVGATFTLPVCRNVLGRKEWRDGAVRFVWAVRKVEEVEWAIKHGAPSIGMEVFVSGASIPSKFSLGEDEDESDDGDGEGEDDIELKDRSQSQALLATENIKLDAETQDLTAMNAKHEEKNIRFTAERPNITVIVQKTIISTSNNVAIIVCGPSSLSLAVKTTLDAYNSDVGSRVWYWNEAFGW